MIRPRRASAHAQGCACVHTPADLGRIVGVADTDEIDWDDLRYFRRAVQAKTLAGAARRLGVQHTTVGRRLSALERVLGAPLVLRGPDGLQLTRLGEKVAPLVEDVERAVVALQDAVASDRSRVRLAVPSGFTGLFAARLAELSASHPGVSLELLSGSRPVDLTRGEADLAIRSGPVGDEDLVARKLCEVGFSLYAAKAYLRRRPGPVDPDELSGHDVIGFDRSVNLPVAHWIESRATHATIVLRSREMTDMLAAAVNGVGIALLPCMLADAEESLTRLVPDVVATRKLSLVYRREARASPTVRAVIGFVCRVIEAHADRIRGAGGIAAEAG